MIPLIEIITSTDPVVRNRSMDEAVRGATTPQLLATTRQLDLFRRNAENLYERVRALAFLAALHRFQLPASLEVRPQTVSDLCSGRGLIPFKGHQHLLSRRFEEAIDSFLEVQDRQGASDAISSALALSYHRLMFQTLADQVRRSVRGVRGNQWMFRMGHPADQPLRIREELLRRSERGAYPILRERTPVRMDLIHSGWSDIFFLGMDFPQGARVVNVSVDLAVHGRDTHPRPPVSAWLRVIDEPVLRLTSVDLGATADISSLAEVFDFAKDHLGLLKAAVIASGVVPPGVEGSGQSLADLLARMVGPGRGIEIVSSVNDIPKGSRLAVSTNLLGSLVAVCMRATSQAGALTGPLDESERRLVLARALLGEWIGGSGGGWQDSGGIWPGIKRIEGVASAEGDVEWGVSQGRLMPVHMLLGPEEVTPDTRRKLEDSLVLVHGGMAQNVGPILEMVTEKYLLRGKTEWQARLQALELHGEVLASLKAGDMQRLSSATTRNFRGPIQDIIPWASTHYTELLIERASRRYGADYWGFCMLGGMSGGGMGFLFAPHRKEEARQGLLDIMRTTKRELEHALPFAMDPVVYDFSINDTGTLADWLTGDAALMPPQYYSIVVPALLRQDRRTLPPARRAELDVFAAAARNTPELREVVPQLFDVLLPRGRETSSGPSSLEELLAANGFDRSQHEQIRLDLKESRVGLAQNRLRADAVVEEVREEDLWDLRCEADAGRDRLRSAGTTGREAVRKGEVAVLTLAAGAGSRWTQGAGVCKALHPFAKLAGRHRTFIETHLAKLRKLEREYSTRIPQIITTSYLTHQPIERFLQQAADHGAEGLIRLSPGRAVGLRMIPTERDLRFAWEEMPQQRLDEQQQKVRDSLRAALIEWARSMGEAADYTDNLPLQCMHPVGHWYEVPNLLRNGTLAALLESHPSVRHLMLHNVDTLGAVVDPGLLGCHIESGRCLNFEVIARRVEDRGGGLARVNGKVRLIEGLALPREEDEFRLSCYNSMTTWIHIDSLLRAFGLNRDDLGSESRVTMAVRQMAARMPTYITLKDVRKRWGHGQEDVYPVSQFEKLWSDMTLLPEIDSGFMLVSRRRGQQLKDQAQLDGWLRDGTAARIESICEFGSPS